jgi:hypothetical protein
LQFLRQRLRENIIDDESQAEELERLRGENEERKLVLATLIRLLAKKGVIDEAEIRAVADGASSEPTA